MLDKQQLETKLWAVANELRGCLLYTSDAADEL